MRSILISSVFLAFLAPLGVQAGPFGVEMGSTVDNYELEKAETKFSFRSVPKPHPMFTTYSGWHSPSHGICRVLAITETIKNDSFGSESRNKFDQVKKALVEKYGPAQELEGLMPGSIWDEPRDWTMSVYKNERTHAADWTNPRADGEEYSLIQLWVVGLSSDDSAIVLEYRSKDFEACNAEIEAGLNDSF